MASRINSGTVTAIAALIVAAAALGTAVWQGLETRRHQRLSVAPALVFEWNDSENFDFVGLKLSNQGTGPGLVGPFHIFVDGEQVLDGRWETAIQRLGIDDDDDWVEWWLIGEVFPWRPGLEHEIFGVTKQKYCQSQDECKSRIDAIAGEYTGIFRLSLAFCACSVYKECHGVYWNKPLTNPCEGFELSD